MGQRIGTRLFVSRLSFFTTASHLRNLFSPFGKITEACLVKDPKTKRPKGFGFVSYESEIEAERAMNAMNARVKKVVFGKQMDSQSLSHCGNSSCFAHPRTIILGFSKGGTVLNQLVTELGFSDVGSMEKSPHLGQPIDTSSCAFDESYMVPKTKETFLHSIDEIHYVDVGLNSPGAYLTNDDVIKGISRRLMRGAPGVRFVLHGTPRQWSDEWRGWICWKKDTLLHLLESEAHKSGGNLQVYEKYYFADRPANLQMHFEIIERLDVNS